MSNSNHYRHYRNPPPEFRPPKEERDEFVRANCISIVEQLEKKIENYRKIIARFTKDAQCTKQAKLALWIMRRRGWHTEKCTESDDWIVCMTKEHTDKVIETIPVSCLILFDTNLPIDRDGRWAEINAAFYHKNPFIALINGDRWYRQNVDRKKGFQNVPS
jgi:hypothetical protein